MTSKVRIDRIITRGAEGETGRRLQPEYPTLGAFERALAAAAPSTPEPSAYDKVYFDLEFADGFNYGARFDLHRRFQPGDVVKRLVSAIESARGPIGRAARALLDTHDFDGEASLAATRAEL